MVHGEWQQCKETGMMPGDGDGGRRRGQYKKGAIQGEGECAWRGGTVQLEGDSARRGGMMPGEGDSTK